MPNSTPEYMDRVDRLYAAKQKLLSKCEKHKDQPAKVVAYKKRIAEYEISIDRIQKGLPEHSVRFAPRPDRPRPEPAGSGLVNPVGSGAHIDVPVDHIGMREN